MPEWWVAALVVRVCPVPEPGCDTTSLAEAVATGLDVEVAPGVYPVGELRLATPGQTLRSLDPADRAVLTPIVPDGPLVHVEADAVRIEDLVFTGPGPVPAPPHRAIQIVAGRAVVLDGLTVQDFAGSDQGALVAAYGPQTEVTITSSVLRDGDAGSEGGALYVQGASVELFDVQVARCEAGLFGGQVSVVDGGSLVVRDSRFTNGTALSATTLRAFQASRVELHRVAIGDGDRGGLGVAELEGVDAVLLDEVRATSTAIPGASFRVVDGGALVVRDSVFAAEDVAVTGLSIEDLGDVEIETTWFCGNTASVGAGLKIDGRCGDCDVHDNVFVGHAYVSPMDPLIEFAQGVAIYADLTAGRLTVRQNTFGANANNYDGTIVSAFGGDVTMLANLFVDNLHGVFSVETLPGASFGANAGLAPGDLPPFDPTPQLLRERPRFVVETAGRRQPAACRDVGPWLLAPRAAENQILLDEGLGAMTRDEDGDGFVGVEDCDDGDPDIFPGAQEVAGDGVDTDCDGLEVCYVDADGDGWGGPFGVGLDWYCLREGLTTRRGDCDDADPEVSPDGLEIAYDGIDQDCRDGDLVDVDGDGSDWPEDCDDEDPTYARCAGYLAGVACQSGPPAPAGLGLLGLVVAFTQGRRRGARSPRSGRRRGAIG